MIIEKCTEKAYAKINLWLDVIGKRKDGYHDIESVMQTVSLCDTVTVENTDGGSPELLISGDMASDDLISLPDDKNLCVRAAKLFFEKAAKKLEKIPSENVGSESGTPDCMSKQASGNGVAHTSKCDRSVRIILEKRIPSAAGLGGGSADAAAVLRAMNKMFSNLFSKSELCTFSAELGADVPFCINGGTYIAEGIGERLSETDDMPDCHIVIAYISGKSSTGKAYGLLDSQKDYIKRDFMSFRKAISHGDIKKIAGMMYNRFETLYPTELCPVKDIMRENGALNQMMSGSGLSVFGIFDSIRAAEVACSKLTEAGYRAFVTRPTRNVE
mgnify:CR=1 FL=1